MPKRLQFSLITLLIIAVILNMPLIIHGSNGIVSINANVHPDFQNLPIVEATDYGLIGDGKVDDTIALKTALEHSSNKVLKFPKNKEIRVVGQFNVPQGCIIRLNGSKVIIENDENERGFVIVGDRTAILNGKIYVKSLNQSKRDGTFQSCIVVGDYGSGTGVRDIVLEDLDVHTERKDGNCIAVTGNSHDIYINNITMPDSETVGRVIVCHWGGAEKPTAGTTHPHDIYITNIKAGRLGYYSPQSAVVYISACYNVMGDNIVATETSRSCITVFAGDYGFYYADEITKPLAFKNIRFTNAVNQKANNFGYYVDGKAYLAPGKPSYEVDVSYKNVTSYGSGKSSGILIQNADGVEIYNANITGHSHGIATGQGVKNLTVKGGYYNDNLFSGMYISNGTVPPQNIIIENVEAKGNGTSNSSQPGTGIFVGNLAKNVKIRKCILGVKNEYKQTSGIKIDRFAVDWEVEDCQCYGIASTGAAYVLNPDSGNFKNNMVANGVKFMR